MSIYTQWARICRIHEDLEEKLIAMAELQRTIYLEEIPSPDTWTDRYKWFRADKFVVEPHTGRIQCYRTYRNDPDEYLDQFTLDENIIKGDVDAYRASLRPVATALKTEKEQQDALDRKKRISQLEDELLKLKETK